MASAPSAHIPSFAALLALGLLGACGMPQAADPAPPPELASAAGPRLLGGLEPELKAASVAPAPARRPGWGTMAPIPNPPATTEFASATPAYRLIGPTAPAADTALAQAPAAPLRETEAKTPAGARTKPRIRHWILPIRTRG